MGIITTRLLDIEVVLLLVHVIRKKSRPISARNGEKKPNINTNIKKENEYNNIAKRCDLCMINHLIIF